MRYSLKPVYSIWKQVAQNNSWSTYDLPAGDDSCTVWTGDRDHIFETFVDADDYSDWNTNFGSSSTEVTTADDAIAQIVGLSGLKAQPIEPVGAPLAASIPAAAAVPIDKIVREHLKNGSNRNMVVDGSGTSVVFTYDAHATLDTYLREVRFLITTDETYLNGASFFELASLTNGCLFQIRSNSTTYDLANLQYTEDLMTLPTSNAQEILRFTGAIDIFSVGYPLADVVLVGGSGDFVKMTIRDKLDDGHIKYSFIATVFGSTE